MLPGWYSRIHSESVTHGKWKEIIADRAERTGAGAGRVYDWRAGVPTLMQLISLRLIVMTAINAEFRNDPRFVQDLTDYRRAFKTQYDKMVDGVRCGFYEYIKYSELSSDVYVACADINTGIQEINKFSDYWSPDFSTNFGYERCLPSQWQWTSGAIGHRNKKGMIGWNPEISEAQKCRESYYKEEWDKLNSKISTIEQDLRRQVLLKMPLFEMRSMIDILYLYAHGGFDLTEAMEHIQVDAAPHLCLDVQWGNPTRGTPLHIWGCNGGHAQQWAYDRTSGVIRNPAYDKCLDVQWGNPAPGTPVHIWDCNGGNAQKWTWDPETYVLQNALGTVLHVDRQCRRRTFFGFCTEWDAFQEGTPVRTSERYVLPMHAPMQRWSSPDF